ncbi:MAG TPA: ABC transporter permease [Trichocoleus sp.]
MNGRIAKGWKKVKARGYSRDWENYRDLLIVLVQKELKVRYNNKAIGYLWSIASPLTSALVYYIALQVFMRIQIPDYALILLSGIFPWQWLSNAIGSSPNLFIGNAGIIKKVNFPRNIVLLCSVLNHMIHFLISIPVLLFFILLFHHTPTLDWLYGIPILTAIQLVLVYGIGIFLATINLFFRDLERLTSILLNFIFYFTPILYPLEQIPETYLKFIWLNPFAPLIVAWRELFLYGNFDALNAFYSLIYAIVFFFLGQFTYRKLSWKFAELI